MFATPSIRHIIVYIHPSIHPSLYNVLHIYVEKIVKATRAVPTNLIINIMNQKDGKRVVEKQLEAVL